MSKFETLPDIGTTFYKLDYTWVGGEDDGFHVPMLSETVVIDYELRKTYDSKGVQVGEQVYRVKLKQGDHEFFVMNNSGVGSTNYEKAKNELREALKGEIEYCEEDIADRNRRLAHFREKLKEYE